MSGLNSNGGLPSKAYGIISKAIDYEKSTPGRFNLVTDMLIFLFAIYALTLGKADFDQDIWPFLIFPNLFCLLLLAYLHRADARDNVWIRGPRGQQQGQVGQSARDVFPSPAPALPTAASKSMSSNKATKPKKKVYNKKGKKGRKKH